MNTIVSSTQAPGHASRRGMALFGVLVLVGSLSMVLGIVYTVVSINLRIGTNYRRQQESFAQADAGIQYVQARLNADLRTGALSLGSSSVDVQYSAPSGFQFDTVTNLTRLAHPNQYLLTVTGRSGPSSTTIQAVLGRKNALGEMGVFGDRDIRLQPGFNIFSYNSSSLADPQPFDSGGKAGVGSNESVTVQPGASVDGVIFLGESAGGHPASCSGAGTIPTCRIDRVLPDPLGIVGGALESVMTHYQDASHNDNARVGIVGDVVDLGAHGSFTLPSGYYYLSSFTLGAHSELIIDSTPQDPAVVFLAGEFRTQPGTLIRSSSRSPRAFYIFASSTGEFRIQPNSEFRGFVYAPYADLRFQPNGDLYGIFWGGSIRMQPNGDLYIDRDSLSDFLSGSFEIVQWKEVRW